MTVALAMKAAIGDVSRFDDPRKLVSYLGLNPSVRQSGPGPAYHGGSPSRAVVMRAACSSRRPGRPLVPPDRCEPSSCACEPGADSMSRPWQPHANSLS